MKRSSTATTAQTFRAEIQGLRGIAVLAVLIFHVSPSLLPGGFLGVDVFLVLSGFLITSQLLNKCSSSSFSLWNFYTRRFLRIYPSLLTLYCVSFPVCVVLYNPKLVLSATDQILSGLLASSNAYYASSVGYFSETASTKPFLHTWSLSLELQFYFFWPLVLVPALRYGRTLAVTVSAVAFCASLAAAEIAQNKSTSFFHLPFRLFEFLVGALLSLFLTVSEKSNERESPTPSSASDVASTASLCSLILAFLFVESQTQHLPGLVSMLPCLATATIIYAGERTRAGSLCCSTPLSLLGKISYSVYLAHWPLIVLYCYAAERTLPSPRQALFLLMGSVLIGVLNYRIVESSSRIRALGNDDMLCQRLLYGTLVASCMALFAFVRFFAPHLIVGPGGSLRSLSERLELSHPSNRSNGLDPLSFSVVGNQRASRTYLVIGDSFAHHLQDFTHFVGINHNIKFVNHALFACPPLSGASIDLVYDMVKPPGGHFQKCDKMQMAWNREILSAKYDGVVIAARWTLFLESRRAGRSHDKEYLVMNSTYSRSTARELTYGTYAPTIKQKRVFFERALSETLAFVNGSTKKILLVAEPPDVGIELPLCERWARKAAFGSERENESCRPFSRSQIEKRVKYSEGLLKRAAKTFNARVFFPRKYFCDNRDENKKYCRIVYKDEVLYFDDSHLNPYGSLYVAKRWLEDNSTLNARNALFEKW